MFEKFIAAFLGAKLGKLAEYESLAKHTTLRVGGPARVFVQPSDKEAFVKIIELVRELELEFKILGKGSNSANFPNFAPRKAAINFSNIINHH